MSAGGLAELHDVQLVHSGPVADVYRAVRVSTGQPVTVERFTRRFDAGAAAGAAERDLATAAGVMNDPHVVRIQSVHAEGDSVYVISDLVEGSTLSARIAAAGGPLPPRLVTAVAADLAAALAAVHAAGLVHGAISPETVIVTTGGVTGAAAKLNDVGLTALTTAASEKSSAHALDYASPQDLDRTARDRAADVYALGATLFHAAVGSPADLGDRLAGVTTLLTGVAQPVRTVIDRCMQRAPEERPNAAEVVALLDTVDSAGTAGGSSTLPPPTLAMPIVEPASRPATFAPPTTAAADASPPPPTSPAPTSAPSTPPAPPAPPMEPGAPSADGATSTTAARHRSVRPPVLIVGALVIAALIVAGVVAATRGDDDDAAPSASTTIPATVPATNTATSGPQLSTIAPATTPATGSPNTTTSPVTTEPPTTSASPPTTVTPATTPAATNEYGDVVGQPVSAPSSAAGRFALALQQGASASGAAVEHTDAFYFLLWSSLTGQSTALAAAPVATADGYRVQLALGALDLSGFAEDGGRVTAFTASSGGSPVDVDAGVVSSGACVPAPDECAALAAAPYVSDLTGAGGRLFTVATITLDPANDSLIMLADLAGTTALTGSADFADVLVDPATALVVVRYGRGADPGTVVTVTIDAADGRQFVFPIAVS